MSAEPDTNAPAIAEGWARGISVATLARSFDRPVDEVEAIVDARRRSEPLPWQLDPEEVVRDHVIRLKALLEELAIATPRVVDVASIRAMAVRYDLEKHLFNLYVDLGLLPSRDHLRAHFDARQAFDRMVDVISEHEDGTELLDALLDEFPPRPWEDGDARLPELEDMGDVEDD